MANQTPEEKHLHETIDDYIRPLWNDINKLKKRIEELEANTIKGVPIDQSQACPGCGHTLYDKSCRNPACSMYPGDAPSLIVPSPT